MIRIFSIYLFLGVEVSLFIDKYLLGLFVRSILYSKIMLERIFLFWGYVEHSPSLPYPVWNYHND